MSATTPTTEQLLAHLTAAERAELERLAASDTRPWRPLPGPQSMAAASRADITLYGGAAGAGKTDLAVGLALTEHRKVGIFRVNGTELTAVNDRIAELLGSRDAYNGSERIWRFKRHDGVDVQVELGSFPAPGDVKKYQGRPRDLLCLDEAANMREEDATFLMGWLRTTTPGQRCRVLLTFNPPQSAEGRWILSWLAPWIDKGHQHPAAPGELRWFAMVDGKRVERPDGATFEHNGERITPQSMTFIPGRITDNPYLLNTGYLAQLQALPEPLRSQLLYGSFTAGIEADPFQVIPTAWIEAAQARWRKPDVLADMDSIGVDIARGGRDNTIIARRHGNWFDTPLVYPGTATPDGPTAAGLVVAAQRDRAPIHIDSIGVGSSPTDFLEQAGLQVVPINVAEKATAPDRSGRLQFRNLRSQLWWKMREMLDPQSNLGIALPPDQRLLADLAAPTWRMVGTAIAVASRDEIEAKIGRSPDFGTAYILALLDTPRRADMIESLARRNTARDYDPLANL